MSVEARDLERAHAAAAALVARYGDAFLPAFLRIEEELRAREDRGAAVERARRVCRGARYSERSGA